MTFHPLSDKENKHTKIALEWSEQNDVNAFIIEQVDPD